MSSDNMSTKPTIETVLERINAIGQELHDEIQQLGSKVEQMDTRVQRVSGEVQQMRLEMEQLQDRVVSGFRKGAGKMEALSDAWLEVRSDVRDLNRRVDKLEGEPA